MQNLLFDGLADYTCRYFTHCLQVVSKISVKLSNKVDFLFITNSTKTYHKKTNTIKLNTKFQIEIFQNSIERENIQNFERVTHRFCQDFVLMKITGTIIMCMQICFNLFFFFF